MAASSPQGVTTSFPFLSCNSAQTPLFSVNPGISSEDALSMASCFLDDAMRVMENDEEINHAAHRLVTMAKAALDSVISGMVEDTPAAEKEGAA
ncbi:DUF3077 domain-containing protein [Propionivibrio sp.]|uniref:DUF3077 domain-containing protein n=1 Tax=Propionivibrio sp. TaxID=2212460 RepID=UPI0039E5FE54